VIAVVIVVLAVLVIAAIVWARVSAARSENRSVETYEHALGVLGEVSKRTESHGFRILPHEETGRAHVNRPIDSAGEATQARGDGALPAQARGDGAMPAQGQLASRRLPPAGEPKLRFSRPIGPAAPDEAGHGSDELETPAAMSVPPRTGGPDRVTSGTARASEAPRPRVHREVYRSGYDHHRQVIARRTATGVAAGAALIAVIVAAIYLSSGGGGGSRAGSRTTTTVQRGGGGGSKTTTTTSKGTSSTTTTTPSTALRPSSSSPLTFTVPSGDYTMAFQATGGACWVGIEHTAAGPWLFAQTMAAGQSARYKGSGSVVVTLGAPAHFSLSVNGLTVELPRGVTQVYSFHLTPSSA
jgi:hypothetical protein